MLNAFFWGFVATTSLIIGGSLGSRVRIGRRTLGLIMAFGAGVLVIAVTYELTYEAVTLAKGSGMAILGLLIGALTFFFSDLLISKMGARGRKKIAGSHDSNLVVPIVLGTIL
ncbi:MAG TPA: hypothetical protein PKH94_10635, partial [Bacteroidales bacterium]|nr:hypothetical protein [Bacteroidales bacterium]